jgi:hypothetical protein
MLPSERQHGYRHLQIEHRLLVAARFLAEVLRREPRAFGEPAFAAALADGPDLTPTG